MALKNEATGEYLKITNFHYDEKDQNGGIGYIIFANLEQRQRWENGLSEYENVKIGPSYNGAGLHEVFNAMPDANLSTMNNIKKNSYIALKNDMFSEWIDA